MSSSSIQGTNSLSRTFLAGSEEDFDIVCDFCHTEGRRVEAVGYCVDCGEYLCCACKNIHTKTSATRNHVLQDKSYMPRTQQGGTRVTGSTDTTDALTDKCKEHPEELIKFFCNSHKQLGCSVCMPLNHRTCDDVSYIRDVSSGIAGSQEFKSIKDDMKKLIARLEFSKSRADWCQRVAEESYKQAIADIQQFRQNINQYLDKLEQELLKEASTLKEETSDSLTSQTPRCYDLTEEIKKMNSDLEKKGELKHHNQLFIALKYAKERIPALQQEADSVSQSVRTRRLAFSHNDKLNNLISSVTSLGTLSMIGKAEGVRVKFLHDICVKTETDKMDCAIIGVVVLPDGRLALTDYDNKSVKLVDVAGRKVTEEVSLASEPRDITIIGNDQLAVTLKGEQCIQVLSLLPTLIISHTVKMPGHYNGITYSAGKLILACYSPSVSVHICDMDGNLLQQIDLDNLGNNLFGTPTRITVSPDQSIMYIGDWKSNKVVCVNSAGVIMTTYVHDRLKYPVGVAVDDDGFVYVCSKDTHTVHQLTCSGQLAKILLEKKNGIKFPYTVAHNAGNLYISSVSSEVAHANKIKVYRLE